MKKNEHAKQNIERAAQNTERAVQTPAAFPRMTIALFLAVLFGLGAAFLLLPDRSFSVHENRYLAKVPAVTTESLLSGDLTRDAENYINDQFPLRDQWIVCQAALQRASGRKDNNGVYFAKDCNLIETFWTYDQTRFEKNLAAVKTYVDEATAAGRKVYFVPVPNAAAVNEHLLFPFAPDRSQAALIQAAQEILTTQPALASSQSETNTAVTVDVLPTLDDQALSGRQLYYRTDHHMTTEGTYLVYRQLMEAMGITPHEESDFEKTAVTDTFRGTLYNKSGAWWTPAESIERWDLKDAAGTGGVPATVTILPSGKQYDTMYNEAALAGNDPHSYFLYGNQPLVVIRTGSADNGAAPGSADSGKSDSAKHKLLLIKDSYAHELVPFLACHFDEIHMIDLRYYHDSIRAYREANGIDTTVILYNVKNFCEDEYVPLITR